ncbi:2OG-Fe(II) oxygenase [Acidobacteria bacterium AB60]|nr:2OG-Fe(II) oxygenase [Acidobacteria bacterium AB60]
MTSPSTIDVAAPADSCSPFPLQRWQAGLPHLGDAYRSAKPVPHIYLDEFLVPAAARALEQEFPKPDSDAWTHYQHQNENKHGMTKREAFPPQLGMTVDALNSPQFVAWLSELTGIPGLLADPMLEGGGLHQSGRGGYLNVHTDFSHHHYHQNWKRRVNLIVYLNEGWQDEWGGAIELWDSSMRHCVAKYPPRLNCAFLFNTNDISYHGFPTPLTCPEGVSRKSLALYYYTVESAAHTPVRSTNYRARPEDGPVKSALIWLDKKAVDLYSRAKARFGFSDEFVSRVLALLSRKK